MGQFDHFRITNKDGSYIFVKDLPWYKKDKTGWPIELIKDKPLKNVARIVFQNIRKVLPII